MKQEDQDQNVRDIVIALRRYYPVARIIAWSKGATDAELRDSLLSAGFTSAQMTAMLGKGALSKGDVWQITRETR